MELKPGTNLGPYEILSSIGAGGMGQVWKARDNRLDRVVAIKVSATEFSQAICPDYLVMEYVEGHEIRGPLPLDRLLRLPFNWPALSKQRTARASRIAISNPQTS